MNTLGKDGATLALLDTEAHPQPQHGDHNLPDVEDAVEAHRPISVQTVDRATRAIFENHLSGCCRLVLSAHDHADPTALALALLALEYYFLRDHDAVEYFLERAEASGLRLHIDRELIDQDVPAGRGMAWLEPDSHRSAGFAAPAAGRRMCCPLGHSAAFTWLDDVGGPWAVGGYGSG